MLIESERMSPGVKITLLNPDSESWASTIDSVSRPLGAPHNTDLFPRYFLKVPFGRIGGQIAVVERGQLLLGVALHYSVK